MALPYKGSEGRWGGPVHQITRVTLHAEWRDATVASDIGRTIKAIRQQTGLRASDVAEAIGLSRPYYTQLEGGTRRLSAEHVRKIARVLGVPVAELFAGEEKGRGKATRPKGKAKHLKPLNSAELRRRLKPLVGEHTDDAVQCIQMLVWAPDRVKRGMAAMKKQMGR